MNKEEKVIYQTEINKEEINALEVRSFEGRITVVEHPSDVDICINYLRRNKVIGFDTESRPSFSKKKNYQVSLVQLALPNEVFLFRIHKTGISSSMVELFEDEKVKKVGVSIHDDLNRLRSLKNFEPAGFIELQTLSSERGIISNSLRKLTAIILGFRLSKAQQLSNWEAPDLSKAQINYAATDAWVSLEIYKHLNSNGHGIQG